jgi:hypothetical protein
VNILDEMDAADDEKARMRRKAQKMRADAYRIHEIRRRQPSVSVSTLAELFSLTTGQVLAILDDEGPWHD